MRLREQDRREYEDGFNHGQRDNWRTAIDKAVIAALGVASLVSGATEGAIGWRVFSDAFAPDIAGQPAHGPVLLMSCSSALASLALHIYLSKHQDALPWKILEKCLPWLILTFIASMGVMATRSVLDAAGFSFSGAEVPPDLFDGGNAPSGHSLFDRIAVGLFGAGLLSLALSNFWLTQQLINKLWTRIKGLVERRTGSRNTQKLLDAINEDEARLSTLATERQALQRELEPQASFEFATELSALVQQLRAPVASVISAHEIWKDEEPSVMDRAKHPQVNIARLKELTAALDLTPEKVHTAFRSDTNGGKKK
jgi:hypothetical protein